MIHSFPHQIKIVKSVVDLLNETFPTDQMRIPSQLYIDRVLRDVFVQPQPIFSAGYNKNPTNCWWIFCVDYPIWRSEEFTDLMSNLAIVFKEEEIKLHFCQVIASGMDWNKEQSLKSGGVFIGRTKSILYDSDNKRIVA